ncbi:MAG: hypothetical protein JOY78_05625 [Pseudonocardia sp.]|nr:hypothetical protein [Pseudonocardia sp.]
MPQRLRTDHAHGQVVISCQVADIDIIWQLAESATGPRSPSASSCPRRRHSGSTTSAS